VRLWDAASGRELRSLVEHGGGVQSVAIAPDGSWLASGGDDGSLRLWDAASGRELRSLVGHGTRVQSVAIAPDGSWLASGGSDRSVRLWDAASGRELRSLIGHDRWVQSVAIAPDGSWLASGGDDGSLRLWDAASGRELRSLVGHRGGVVSVAIASEGRLFVAGDLLSCYPSPAAWPTGALPQRIFESRVVQEGVVTVYPDGTHAGNGAALEWLEYEEIAPATSAADGKRDVFPTLHRATDLPWLRRKD
jgi:WD40 repeat protein